MNKIPKKEISHPKPSNNNDLWINKYKPTSVSQIIGNNSQIADFKSWLENLSTSKNQGIVISGNQGLGKTLTIRQVLDECGYIPRIIKASKLGDAAILKELIKIF